MSYRLSSLTLSRRTVSTVLAAGTLLACAAGLNAMSARAATLPTLSVALKPSSITVGGAPQAGGVNVVTTATGTKEGGILLFLLKPGVSAAEFLAFLSSKAGQDPNNAGKYGAVVFNAEAPAGRKSEAQTTLAPGQYVALNIEGEGKPKANATFTVTASSSPAVLPAPGATIRTIDFGFRGPNTLHVGELVRFENEGFEIHMNVAFRAKNRNAAKKIVKALASGNEKGLGKLVVPGPPATFAGPLSTGAYQQATITAAPGWYVEACFMETQDGRSHTRLGMERVIKITK
jgi:hypothetical protein